MIYCLDIYSALQSEGGREFIKKTITSANEGNHKLWVYILEGNEDILEEYFSIDSVEKLPDVRILSQSELDAFLERSNAVKV